MGSVIGIPAINKPETTKTILEPRDDLREIIDEYLGMDAAKLYDEVIETAEQDIWDAIEEEKMETDKSAYDLICELADTIPDYGAQQEEYDRLMDAILAKAGRWIPVTEDIPEDYGNYLVQVDSSDGTATITFMAVDHYSGTWLHYNEKQRKVVAWRPLPEPYKGVQ